MTTMPRTYTLHEVKEILKIQYTNLNFDEFCAIINEPVAYYGEVNYYALDKFNTFRTMVQSMGRLGFYFDKVFIDAART